MYLSIFNHAKYKFLIFNLTNFQSHLPGTKYKLSRSAGCMKEVQGNADIIKIWHD